MFGGVHDTEDSEEGIDSEFFNDLFAWNIERNRFYKLALRRPRTTARKPIDDKKKNRGKSDEAELLRNLAALESNRRIEDIEQLGVESSSDEDEPTRPAKPVTHMMPRGRFNALLATQKDVLFIYGGTLEQGDREYNFDEMYSLDLGKLDGVHELYKREQDNWVGEEHDSDSEDEDYSDDEMDIDDVDDGEVAPPKEASDAADEQTKVEETVLEQDEAQQDSSMPPDTRPHPRPFESLRAFFSRTTVIWQDLVMKDLEGSGNHQSIKELRKIAFAIAEARWWDLREEISVEEERLEGAGAIGEVVSLADMHENVGTGRRR